MNGAIFCSPENEVRFLLSLLHIAKPGEPVSEQSRAIEQLLPAEASR